MLIEKLKEYIENNNIEIRSKLIKEINVEFEENELLVKSFFEPEFKEELNNELEYVSRYLKTLQYADIDEIKKTIKDAFSNKEFKYLIKEIENAIEFLRQNNNNDINREYIYKLIKINNIIEPLEKYVKSQIVVVNGDGGTGKTHLLTKIANDMLDNDIPTIIFYGQNMYDIEKYINYIEQNMKINNLFEDISKQATQKNQTGIVIFDAINETRQVQIDVINYLLKNIFGKNIKLVISYRNGDIKANIKNLLDKYPQITLYGFSDVIEAAVKFSEYYNIDIGEILETNFANNPLILKIFCEAYNEKAEEKGQRGFVAA
ncbi:MAG: AAA family ATPase, partial [Mycoplasmataceae bacterium]|nr:AAA family ATPase [Mycoplasmataceae bacterium]